MSGSDAGPNEATSERDAGGSIAGAPFGTFDPTSRGSIAFALLFAVLAALTAAVLAREVRRQWRIR